jgi:hypothetical protein
MLTDDDLTRELAGAFRNETDDLRYAGRVPTPRTGPGLVPLATTAVVAGVLGTVWVVGGTTDAPVPPSAGPGSTRTTDAPPSRDSAPTMVTDTIEVAGFTFAYERAADVAVPDVLHVFTPDAVPEDARPIDVPAPAKAWVGTDPRSGQAALYLQSPPRNDGRLFGVSAPGLDEDAMVEFLRSGA